MSLDDKIKREDRELLLGYIGKFGPKDQVISLELLDIIARLSATYNVEIAIAINRKGLILDISTGTSNSASIIQYDNKKGLNGVRLIHTHPFASCELSKLDISALNNDKFDCVIAVAVDERGIVDAQAGFIEEDKVSYINMPNALYINKYGILEKIQECDRLYKQKMDNMYLTSNSGERAVLVKVALNNENIAQDLEELTGLANSAGIMVVDRISQNRVKPDGKYYIGEGKLEALKNSVQLNNATVVIFDNELSGGKAANLTSALGVRVIDRSMLILDIFAGRARTAEGKIQVELAQLKYNLPRLNSLAVSADRFGGGVGMRGPGESKLELNRRVVENDIVKKQRELQKLKRQRQLNRSSRLRNGSATVALVGYTNSGKSTLMNLISRAGVYAKDQLFATLDTTTRSVWLGEGKEILLTDTVGFIKNLPHEFIEAFSSTLEESVYANLILHVVDISNPNNVQQQQVVLDQLAKLKCASPIITVYNKIDNVDPKAIKVLKANSDRDTVFVSAITGEGVEQLKEMITEKLF